MGSSLIESKEQVEEKRKIKREISSWLTSQINDLSIDYTKLKKHAAASSPDDDSVDSSTPKIEDFQPFSIFKHAVRGKILESLKAIDTALNDLEKEIKKDFDLLSELKIFQFYIKGGNAFKFTVEGEGAKGKSDWDTQLLINPWLPERITEEVYARVENIITAILENTALNVSETFEQLCSKSTSNDAASTPATKQKTNKDTLSLNDYIQCIISCSKAEKNLKKPWMDDYGLVELKEGEVVKQFSHINTGLWESTNTKIKSKFKNVPSVIESDRIAPFKIFRLGWNWKTKLNGNPTDNQPLEIKSILMELIDITIPRKYTLEAITQWHVFIEDQEGGNDKAKIQDEKVTFERENSGVDLPFPNVFYHAHEQLIMLCEIADGSSEHKDKFIKRIERFCLCEGRNPGQLNEAQQLKLINEVNGGALSTTISNISDVNTFVKALDLTEEINEEFQEKFKNNTSKTLFAAIGLMRNVKSRSEKLNGLVSDQSTLKDQLKKVPDVEQINQFITNLAQHRLIYNKSAVLQTVEVLGAAYSNDVVLEYILGESQLLDISKIKSIALPNLFFSRMGNRATLLAAEKEFCTRFQPAKTITHNNFHSKRLNYFSTCLSFDRNGKIQNCITFMTANQAEAPFYQFEEIDSKHLFYADLRLIAQQRKAIAALTMDYVLHTSLSKQVKAIYSLIGEN